VTKRAFLAVAGAAAFAGAIATSALAAGIAPGAESGGAVLFESCASLGDGAACDDGNACTAGDVCQDAVCVPGSEVSCGPAPLCRLSGCDPATGLCNQQRVPNGSLCFLGGPTDCSVGDRCNSGFCFRNFDLPPPEQRDSDFDGICTTDDLCPTVVNPGQEDADGDLAGDACDANDGLLLVHAAVLRKNRNDRQATGRLTLRGEILSRGGEGLLPFNPDGGIAVHLADAASFALDHSWPGDQCSGSGRIRCFRPGRPTARISFRPLEQRTDGRLVYTFDLKLDAVDVAAPLVSPLEARLTSQPATPVIGFDRVGAVEGCREGPRRFACLIAAPSSASEAFLDLPVSLVD
jgi:hypothetical protein